MPTIIDKSEAVELLRREYEALATLGASLSDEQWDAATCLPGWTVRDVFAHVIGAESMLSGEAPPEADVSHLDHMRNAIAEANEVWVVSMRHLSGSAMLARFGDVTGRRLTALEGMTQTDFDAPSWTPAGPDETYGRFMRIRHYDCFMHEHDIRGALGAPPRADAAAIRSSLDEVATGLGYIVGRRAALPDGSRVEIDLTGPVEATYRVQVDGRAAVVDSFDQPPTVGLELPAMLFLRLTGGRVDGPDPGSQIVVRGDRDLSGQLVANLAFTI
ncbi:MAG: maleylpyruvate isomerase family mycothiol-dependent enzyme [Acidimicrobiales bacterium]